MNGGKRLGMACLTIVFTLLGSGCSLVRPASVESPAPPRPSPTGTEVPTATEASAATGSPAPTEAPAAQTSEPAAPTTPPAAIDRADLRPRSRFHEVRALWVVRTSLTSPESVRRMVASAEAGGFNTLLVQVRGRGDSYYRSGMEPLAEALASQPLDFDPLAVTLAAAHDRGIDVHAWVNVHLVSSAVNLPSSAEHLVWRHPEWLALPRELAAGSSAPPEEASEFVRGLARYAEEHRASVEGLFSSPVHPEVREWVAAVVADIARRYPIDGIHLDYVRYPNPDFDYSAGALSAFRSFVAPTLAAGPRAALDLAAETRPTAWPDGLPEEWNRFRRTQVTRLVGAAADAARAARPGILVSAAVMPDVQVAESIRYQEWPLWLEQGIIDAVVPMVYTPDAALFERQVDAALRSVSDPTRLWIGLGAYQTTLEGALGRLRTARREGAGGISVFSYDWAAEQGTGAAGYLRRFGQAAFPTPSPRR